MKKYYTRVCNFYYGKKSIELVKKKKTLPLNGNNQISFDQVEILSRGSSRIISLNKINKLPRSLKNKINNDLKLILNKKKNFSNFNFNKLPNIMGILNLTPDSFSDGGKFNIKDAGYKHAINLINSGADIIDIGGESTRPGSKTVNKKIEWKRIEKIIKKTTKKMPISLDTRKSFIMEKGINLGVKLINDISGLNFDKNSINVLKKYNIPFVIQHSKGSPEIMQKNPKYQNVLLDIYDFFEAKIKFIRKYGIKHNNIIIDPGIGFGKNLKHNMIILKNISIFHSLGFPVMLGVSRKKFIKDLSKKNDSQERLGGTVSSSIYSIMQGIQILRIHDVNEIIQSIKVFQKLLKD